MILDITTKSCNDETLRIILSILKRGMTILWIVGPILAIISISLCFCKMAINPDEKEINSNKKKIYNSVIALVVLFFIPMILNFVLSQLGDTFSFSSCWNSISTTGSLNGGNWSYIPLDEEDKTNPFGTSDYDSGEEGVIEGNKNKSSSSSSSSSSSIEGSATKIGDVVWDPNDVTKISNLTSTQLVAILNKAGGSYKVFVPYASDLITAENKYGVNVFFLIGLEAMESGWMSSRISQNCNNLGGVCSSSSHPSNGCGSNSNCSFAYFSSVKDFIDYHASFLKKSYLTPGAAYYSGVDIASVYTKHYCPGCTSGLNSMKSIANKLFNNVSGAF